VRRRKFVKRGERKAPNPASSGHGKAKRVRNSEQQIPDILSINEILCYHLNMNSFQTVIQKYRKTSFSERDKGDRFERLMRSYLATDPQFAGRFKTVWMWEDFPRHKDLGGRDTGIDLVALTTEGDYWAVQCKCFQETATIDKPAVDTFLSTSSRTFLNEQLETVSFAHRLWISTSNKWGANILGRMSSIIMGASPLRGDRALRGSALTRSIPAYGGNATRPSNPLRLPDELKGV
jgi:hypothetical protein